MFDKKKNKDVCYCETCRHETARECISLQCPCCLQADRIRLEHVIVPENDLSEEQKAKNQAEERDEEESMKNRQLASWTTEWV